VAATVSGLFQAEPQDGRHGDWPAGRRVVTQADRSQWQRSATGALFHLVDTFSVLPALTWTVSRSGHLSGWAGDAIAAGDRRGAFTAWQEALEFPDARESPGTSGSPVRLHSRGQWGPVSIGLAADVVPAGAGQGPAAGARKGGGGFPVTHREIATAGTLVGLLEEHAEAEAITWRVQPSGLLTGRISAGGAARDGRALFRSWVQVLDLDDVTTAPVGQGGLVRAEGRTSCGTVGITITAVVPIGSRRAGREAVARRMSQQADVIRELPHPGRCRIGGTLLRPYSSPGAPDPGQRPSPGM
jgi:hypothetical protein